MLTILNNRYKIKMQRLNFSDAQLQKQRADILKLKSLVGHKNIEIQDLKLEAEDVIDITETKIPNFLPASVKFHEVTQELKK